MKLLILAQTPPPLHGQSVMVRTAVEGLPRYGIEVTHVNLRLSRSHSDIGGWQLGKVLAILDACFHAVVARFTEGCDTLYYVPAPAKRGALYRDWLVMALCRPFFRRLVLHFHNGGLGEWVATRLTPLERVITHALLGRSDVAIVLAESLASDAQALSAKQVISVPNGIIDPAPRHPRPPVNPDRPLRALFIGLCSEDKGLFLALDAVRLANEKHPGAVHLEIAGAFPDATTQARYTTATSGRTDVDYHGFISGDAKAQLLTKCDCLCLPTHYRHEAQPLALLEALALDIPVIATSWRAIPATLGPEAGRIVPPLDAPKFAEALLALRDQPPPAGAGRRRFLENFTLERHLAALAKALGN